MVTATGKNVGQITQVIGSTFDAQFPQDQMPAIYNAVKVESDKKGVKLRWSVKFSNTWVVDAFAAWLSVAPTA